MIGRIVGVVKATLDSLGITTAGVYTTPSSGWTDSGSAVTTTTATDGVGIGAAPGANEKLGVTGDSTRKDIFLTAGTPSSGDTDGGDVVIAAGAASGSGEPGDVQLS